jgi:N-acetylneuraminate synthase
MAIPLLKGQLSCREIMNGEKLLEKISAHEALSINHIDGPYHDNDSLRALILNRGLSREG